MIVYVLLPVMQPIRESNSQVPVEKFDIYLYTLHGDTSLPSRIEARSTMQNLPKRTR